MRTVPGCRTTSSIADCDGTVGRRARSVAGSEVVSAADLPVSAVVGGDMDAVLGLGLGDGLALLRRAMLGSLSRWNPRLGRRIVYWKSDGVDEASADISACPL
jgi:hypothetical protein